MSAHRRSRPRVNIAEVARTARPRVLELCQRWLPGGRLMGHEWTCGSLFGQAGMSCKVNIRTGRWADFASSDKGGDAVSLCAAVHHLSQVEAAERLAKMLGMGGATDGR